MEDIEKHMIEDTLHIDQIKPGMHIMQFIDVPTPFSCLNEKMITFLNKYSFTEMSIVRDGECLDIESKDLKINDSIIRFGKMNKHHKISNEKSIEILKRMGFKQITVSFRLRSPEEIKKYNTNKKKRITQEARGQMHHLQDSMKKSGEIIEKGFDALNSLFKQGKTGQFELTGVKELAKNMLENVLDNSHAMNVLTTLKDHNEYTFRHCIDVANQVVTTCKYMGNYSEEALEVITLGGMLHDIGKSKIPNEILNKPGKLTDEEWVYMRKHPVYSGEIIEDLGLDKKILSIAYSHHCKKNGGGYPEHLKFEDVDELGRITAIADVFQALVTNRPYRTTDPPNIALQRISEWAETDFDERLVEQFIRAFGLYPAGSLVKLSNHQLAFVFANTGNSMRPKIVTVLDETGNKLSNFDFMDLSQPDCQSIHIIEAVDHRKYFKDNEASEFFVELEF